MAEPTPPRQILTLMSLDDLAARVVARLTDRGREPLYTLAEAEAFDGMLSGGERPLTLTFEELDDGRVASSVRRVLAAELLRGDDAHECELCSQIFFGDHYSAVDCNETGLLVTLCKPCVETDAQTGLAARDKRRAETRDAEARK